MDNFKGSYNGAKTDLKFYLALSWNEIYFP